VVSLSNHERTYDTFSQGEGKQLLKETKKPIPFSETGSQFSSDHIPTLSVVKGLKDDNAWPPF